MKRLKLAALWLLLLLLTACGQASAPGWDTMEPIGHMDLSYAEQFRVDYYPENLALITIGGTDEYLLVPEGGSTPEGLGQEIRVLHQPLDSIYLASSSAMDLFLRAEALEQVTMTSTDAAGWTIPEIAAQVESGTIRYVGKYSAPDYEAVVSEECKLAVENTMIYHCPETKEQLEALGIPVLVERSSYEPHPLGRVEWIKLYGLLTGHPDTAERFFGESEEKLLALEDAAPTGKTASFFYITSSGYANVRKPGDYISEMIRLAGGIYLFQEDQAVEDNALSTVNLPLENFYASAREADILIYNSTVDGELETLEDLLKKSPLLGDFKAVETGQVWCTNQNMFQQVSATADMIGDLHTVLTGEDQPLHFLHRLT